MKQIQIIKLILVMLKRMFFNKISNKNVFIFYESRFDAMKNGLMNDENQQQKKTAENASVPLTCISVFTNKILDTWYTIT